ncbi:outer membrane lipoprotein chaperone LolA [Brackiella oedipodis]|uniref:outer membrane lipoprotein chaperone LolA n=1 Tax=Brackiella oedipodis TaxID=124225 RepID=UPI00048D7984|nr:outer membrane lipoprotein chaperone LolA [Brackiella oedipodis]
MKKIIALTLAAVLAQPVLAQDFKVNSEMLDPQQGLVTDLGKVEFTQIPDVQNKSAGDAKKQLSDFVKNIKSASGQFAQQGGTNQAKSQSGSFEFKRPGKFIWHVKKPYEQQVISDGKTVYQYDPDLNQVSKRPVNQAVGASPASILFGSSTLDDSFKVEVLPEKNNMVWLRATPKVADQGMAYVDIAFANNLPAQLNIKDSFGNITQIKLRNLKSNHALPDLHFKFKAPAGVDAVDM